MKLAVSTLTPIYSASLQSINPHLTGLFDRCLSENESLIMFPKNYVIQHSTLNRNLLNTPSVYIINYDANVAELISINKSLLTDDTLYLFTGSLIKNTLTFITKDISENAVFDILFRSSDSIFQ